MAPTICSWPYAGRVSTGQILFIVLQQQCEITSKTQQFSRKLSDFHYLVKVHQSSISRNAPVRIEPETERSKAVNRFQQCRILATRMIADLLQTDSKSCILINYFFSNVESLEVIVSLASLRQNS